LCGESEEAGGVRAAGLGMLESLVKKGRMTGTPHVTLVHQNQTEESGEMKRLWEKYQKQVLARTVEMALTLGPTLIWDDRVMILEATLPSHSSPHAPPTRYHVTVGTADESIRPVEGFSLLHRFFRTSPDPLPTPNPDSDHEATRDGQVLSIHLKAVSVNGTLKGLA